MSGRIFRIKTWRAAVYTEVYDAMRAFTQTRTADTPDEIWLCEHLPVYTLGVAGRIEHVLCPHGIPVVPTDRGGQVTYHGPGQVVAYVLMDMHRCRYYVKDFVRRLEQTVIHVLKTFGLEGLPVDGAPGVYVEQKAVFREFDRHSATATPCFDGLAKISALGIKVRNHCTYHGIALNVKMDLKPFSWINPCGYEGLQTTDMFSMGALPVDTSWDMVARNMACELTKCL